MQGKIVAPLMVLALVAVLGMAACGSNADTVSENIKHEAEKFKVGRRIVVTNDILNKEVFRVEGRCSFEVAAKRLDVVCKDTEGNDPEDFTKATIGLGDNTSWASVQLKPIKVSEYRTKIILRPTSIIPDLDLVTGKQDPDPAPR